MKTLSELRDLIELAFLGEKFLFTPEELYEPIRYTLGQSGKRIRPLLVMSSCDLFGGNLQKAIPAAIGIEVFHNFTLLHDDIMDQAPIRRGKETVYKKWNTNTAILSGDTMLVLAYEYISRADADLLPALFEVFNLTGRQVCEGQQFDMNFESLDSVSIEEYLGMIRLKTAVLLGCCMKTGAIIGRAGSQDAERMYKAGESLGMAFQLQDDLLDSFGDEVKFGKTIGGDISANKKTFLYLKALEMADHQDKITLLRSFSGEPVHREDKIKTVLDIYSRLGIKEETEKLINTYFLESIGHLESVSLDKNRKAELFSFFSQLLKRDS